MPVPTSSIRSSFLPVTRFGLGLETSSVSLLASPEMLSLRTLTRFEAYEFQQVFNRYLETLDSSQVRNLQELVDWNRQNADRELPKGTHLWLKFIIAFHSDTYAEYPSQSSLESALQCNISAAENAETLAFLRRLAGPDGIDQILNLFSLDAIASLADSPLSSVASAAGRYPLSPAVSNQS